MAKQNGNLKWLVTMIGLAMILAGAVASHQIISACVDDMKPKVELNSQHRLTDEADTPYIKQSIAEIKVDFRDFRTEQRIVNKQIIDKLNE
jgi:hypothetical protein